MNERTIEISWSTEDVKYARPDLTTEQAWVVLREAFDNHDASIGLNWDLLEYYAADLYPLEDG